MKDVEDLTKKVTSLYDARVKRAAKLKKEVANVLDGFRQEETGIVFKLQTLLAEKQSLRKKDFDLVMEKILSRHGEKEKEISGKLDEFQQAEEQMAEQLKKLFEEKQKPAIDSLRSLALSLQERQRLKAGEVQNLLTSFSNNHEETTVALRKLLEKGGKIKIKDFKKMIAQLKLKQAQKQDEIREALLEFRSELEERMGKLREELTNGEMDRKAEFEAMMADILTSQEKRSREVTKVLKDVGTMLKDFQEEREQAESRLRQKLAA